VKTPNPKPQTLNPVYLGLDTATPFLSLALWSAEKGVLAHFAKNVGRDHAKRIIVDINALFQSANILPAQLAGIGVGVGPGSYTGVRVGIATAKALAKGLKVPLVGASTLAAMAYGALQEGERGVIALDARRESIYAGVFEKQKDEVLEHLAPQKVRLETLRKEHSRLPYFQDVCPDPRYIAQLVLIKATLPVEAIYL
jgi:tRNA threonylcarbamoyladenosine biosynthesis protein TsaB